jgi:hypothetical protein
MAGKLQISEIEEAWQYCPGDDWWRLYDQDKIRAIIHFHGFSDGKCVLRVRDGEELVFPDLWTAKIHGFAVNMLLNIYGPFLKDW